MSQCVLITPAVLRVGREETIILDAYEQTSAFTAQIQIIDFPLGSRLLFRTDVHMNPKTSFLAEVKLQIKDFYRNENTKQFVHVSVNSSVCSLQKVLLLSYDSGYIFIQTDQPVYTPGSKVMYRIFLMDSDLKPAERHLVTEILNPDGVIVSMEDFSSRQNIVQGSVKLPEFASPGTWTISARHDEDDKRYSTDFVVKLNNELIQTDVKVELKPETNYFPIDDEKITVEIHAQYNIHLPLHGKAFVMFGLKKNNEKERLTETLKQVEISNGKGRFDIKRKELLNNFRKPEDLLDFTLYVAASVFSDSGNHMQNPRLENIPFVKSPFKIFLTQTPNYFTPGYYLDLKVLVTYPDGTPAKKIPIVSRDVRGMSDEDGISHLRINTRLDTFSIQITVKTALPSLPVEMQASASFVAKAKRQESGKVLFINPSSYKIRPREKFFMTIIVSKEDAGWSDQDQYFTYLILNKGKIIRSDRVKRNGDHTDIVISDITEEFMPSFRIVAYCTIKSTTGTEIVSDSILVEGTDSCMGTLVVTGQENRVYTPGSSMTLTVKADHKAIVGLVTVQKRLYEQNEKLRMWQKKVWDIIDKSDLGCTPGRGVDNMEVFYDAGLAVQSNFKVETRTRADLHCNTHKSRSRRSAGEDVEISTEDVFSRTLFSDSWSWKTVYMSEKPDKDGISSKQIRMFLKDSLATWQFLAISLSPKGICVAEPYEYRVRQDFFVDLKLPYSVPRNEEVEIQGVVYNYQDVPVKVKLFLIYNKDFCSLSTPNKDYYQDVTIGPQSSHVVPFIIIPLVLGSCRVEVKAIGSPFRTDGIQKFVIVTPEGVQVIRPLIPIVLDPAVNGKEGIQEVKIPMVQSSTYLRTNIRTMVTIRGLPASHIAEKPIDGLNLKHLIKPIGQTFNKELCMNMAALHYLDVTSQWEKIGFHYRAQALKHLTDGFSKQRTLSKPNYSYGISQGKPSSTWFTAFVVKVLYAAWTKIEVDTKFVCGAIKWLILEKQSSDGSFVEDDPVSDQSMTGGLNQSPEPKTLLTAFVLIAMLETQNLCHQSINNLEYSVAMASLYLEQTYTALTAPYSIAITSYALSLSGRLKSTTKLMSAATDKSQWKDMGSDHVTIEGTSYALLTLLTIKQYDLTAPIVRWLISRRFYGGESAMQATILMFKALARYHSEVPSLDEVNMEITARNMPLDYTFHLHKKALVERTFEIYNQDVVVTAKGKGQALLAGKTIYYEAKPKRETICKNFDLSVTLNPETTERRPQGAKQTFSIDICVRHQKVVDAASSILNITMLTGFFPDLEGLKKLRSEPLVGRFEMDMETSERSHLIVFLHNIPHKEEKCLKIRGHQYYDIGRNQPAPVTVYEYYAPAENSCTAYYNVEKLHAIPSAICQNGECRCFQDNCAGSQTAQEDFSVATRLEKACKAPADYVYKVTIADIESGDTYDSYVMSVDRIFKSGTDQVLPGESRKFVRGKSCWHQFGFAVGRSYLVWGKIDSIWDQHSQYIYFIDNDSWIESFPSETECLLPKNGKICDDLSTFTEHLEFFGCHQE
ncbi:complement C3-like [Hyla sarda]|uniref:complement C3-like n=1 Tax=Hyla sarda TaxID=327740 RepID=UPI0024C23DDA|nr:complement C3-like [Hyla sarda]